MKPGRVERKKPTSEKIIQPSEADRAEAERRSREEKRRDELMALKKWQQDRKLIKKWRRETLRAHTHSQGTTLVGFDREEYQRELRDIQFDYWVEHAFKQWLEQTVAALSSSTDAFAAIARLRVSPPEWGAAAAGRAADMQLHVFEQIGRAPVPPSIAGDDKLEKIYCDSMDNTRESYRRAAIGGYRHCLEVSTKLRWFNEESRHCEERLNELLPEEYPIAAEIMPPAEHELSFIDVPGPILERKKGEDPSLSEIDPLEGIPDAAD